MNRQDVLLALFNAKSVLGSTIVELADLVSDPKLGAEARQDLEDEIKTLKLHVISLGAEYNALAAIATGFPLPTDKDIAELIAATDELEEATAERSSIAILVGLAEKVLAEAAQMKSPAPAPKAVKA